MPTPREVVADIRRRYRADEPASDDDLYREMVGGLLPLVADELYESSTHFFRELLQNADDNSYGPGVVPTLVLTARPGVLELRNNETGFEEKHVRALCNAAKSTKRDRKDAATGEKGIGFKAVFQVSERPEVHSNGFHFRFDKGRHGGLGRVIPEWIDGAADSPGTTILLPLRADYQLPADFLKSLQPELLLFLRRLRRIEFHDPDYGQSLVLHRTDDGPNVEVVRTVTDDVERARSGEARHRFRVHRKRVAMADIQEQRRPNISASEVAVALPLDSDGSVDERCPRDLYAFLPVKASGLRFLAHADFVVATSREAVREDLPWNVRLRDALAECLTEAVLDCRSTPVPGATALRVLADPKTAADGFLGDVLAQAIEALSEQECVPTIDGGWARPADTIMTDQAGLWRLVPPEDAAELLRLRYVTPGVDRIEQTLSRLGVGRFSLDSLLICIGNDPWRATRKPEWFGDLYASLGALRLNDNQLGVLKRAPVVLLESSRTVAPAATLVFRSLGGESRYGFEHEISLLAPSALLSLAEGRLRQAHELLQRLGVTDATPTAVIERHILSAHRGDGWEECTDDTLVGHAHYLRDNLKAYLNAKMHDKREAALRDVSEHFTVLSTAAATDGRYTTASSVYLGRAYGDPDDLEGLLGGDISQRLVSPEYLQRGHPDGPDASRGAWAELFKKLGARTLPPVYYTDDRTDYQWGSETASVIASTDLDRKARLLSLIDRHWDLHFASWKARPGRAGQASSMLLALRSMQVQTSAGAAALAGTYAETDGNRSVFGDSVPYLAQPLKSAGLADALGVTTVPTVMHAIGRLRQIRESKVDLSLAKPMVASLLRFLESRWGQQSAEIKAALAADPLVPADGADGSVWAATGSCCWTLPRDIRPFSRLSGLSGTWRDFQGFFCEKLGVPDGPTPESLVDALEAMSRADIPHEQATRASRAVLTRLRQEAADVGDARSAAWVQRLRQGLLIWTHHHQWWRNDGDVFAADDPSFERLFASAPAVAFVNLPREELTVHRDLLRLLDIRRLTDAISTSVPDDVRAAEWVDFRHRLAERLRAIARYLHHKHPRILEEAAESGAFDALRALDVQRCSPLLLDVSLGELRAQHAFDARMIRDGTRWSLYVDSAVKGYDSAAIEIGRLLGLTDTESLPIGTLLEKGTLGEAERFLEKTLLVPDLPAEVASELFGDPREESEHADDDYDEGHSPAGSDDGVSGVDTPPLPAESELPAGDLTTGSVDGAVTGPSVGDAGSAAVDGGGTATAGAPAPGVAPGTAPPAGGGGEGSPGATTWTQNGRTRGPKDHASSPERDGAAVDAAGRPNAGEPDGEGLEDEEVSVDGRPGGMGRQPGHPGGPPTRPDAQGRDRSSRPPTDRPSEQLRSRVVPEPEAGEDGDVERSADIARIAAAAMRHVLAWENQQGRTPTDENVLNPHHQGYDITSRGPTGEVARYIEVKGVAGAWGLRGVEVTPRQFEFSLAHGELSWLYVVEHALGDAPVIHRIQDFARRVWRYGFDCGWREVGEESAPAWPEPVVGARVRLSSGETGTVTRVFGAGVNRGVEVKLEQDGGTRRVMWQPSRVTPLADAEGP